MHHGGTTHDEPIRVIIASIKRLPPHYGFAEMQLDYFEPDMLLAFALLSFGRMCGTLKLGPLGLETLDDLASLHSKLGDIGTAMDR